MLKSLGIEKGRPYYPDEKTIKAIRQGAIDAYHFFMYWFDNVPKEKLHWQDRHYLSMIMTDDKRTFIWEYPNYVDLHYRSVSSPTDNTVQKPVGFSNNL